MTRERYARVRSKNHSCSLLRYKNKGIGPFALRSLVRLGSTTTTKEAFPKSYGIHTIIEVNTVEAIQNSRSKLLMKQCFKNNEVKQANWFSVNETIAQGHFDDLSYPIIAKRVFGFKGKGMSKIDNKEQLEEWLKKSNTEGYYFEQFFNGAREYRLHITENGCFMAWRKLRRNDTPDDRRWYFNSDYCNWVGENHETFNKPRNWNLMVGESVKALKAVGLDIGCVDLRCQGYNKDNPEFIIVEINSAPSLAAQGIEAYREEITKVINNKINKI